jgi:hypothetical protein
MIAAKAIHHPVIALTAIAGVLMYRRRVAETKSRRIPPKAVATSAQMAARLSNVAAADNVRDLQETPVVFYAAALAIRAGQLTGVPYRALAWAYVAARVAHCAIHGTCNKVTHRPAAFLASLSILRAIRARIAWDPGSPGAVDASARGMQEETLCSARS